MRPVLEERAVLLGQMGEILRLVCLIAGKEDLVMRPLDPLDTVDLDEAKVVDELIEPLTSERLCRRAGQTLPFKEDFSRQRIGDQNRHSKRLGHVRGLFNR